DGTLSHSGATGAPGEYQFLYDTQRAVPADLSVGGLFFFEEQTSQGTVVITVEVDPGATIPDPQNVWIHTVIYEDPVQRCCGSGGNDIWPRVARKLLPATVLEASQPGELQTFELNFLLDPTWNTKQLGGVVFIQRGTDRTVLAAAEGQVSGVLEPLPISFFDATRVNLFQNAPNPTRNRTQIDFFLPEADDTSLRILDARGRVVRVLTDGPRTQGFHPFLWDGMDHLGRPVAAGMYVYVLETSTDRLAKRLVILR
ncbi:MAG: T9SS type A sorting domain-containing protein, partial [Gemmatimonadetes bacterium]|nr:T9SS type A sorting domain-containing protein [Gemmatimonadota bacterium]